MTRVEENEEVIKAIQKVAEYRLTEEAYEEDERIFYLFTIASTLTDISKSFAVIADKTTESENKQWQEEVIQEISILFQQFYTMMGTEYTQD